jgi:hypothetical protein
MSKHVEIKIPLPKSAYDFLTEILSQTSGLRLEDWICPTDTVRGRKRPRGPTHQLGRGLAEEQIRPATLPRPGSPL